MKKAGFIAASMGTALALAAGAVGIVHVITHPGDLVEEANAAEVVRPAQAAAAPAADASARQTTADNEPNSAWGPLSFIVGDGERTRTERATPRSEQAPASPQRAPRGDDDDDDD